MTKRRSTALPGAFTAISLFAMLGLLVIVLFYHSAQRWRWGFPLDVADHRAEFWVLYPGGAVGRYDSHDRDADDSQNMCLRMGLF